MIAVLVAFCVGGSPCGVHCEILRGDRGQGLLGAEEGLDGVGYQVGLFSDEAARDIILFSAYKTVRVVMNITTLTNW